MRKLLTSMALAFASVSSLSASLGDDIQDSLVRYQNFPNDGVMFLDISPVLEDESIFAEVVDDFYEHYKNADFDVILGLEPNGIALGSILSYRLNKPLVIVQQPNSLPGPIYTTEYANLYDKGSYAIRKDALETNQNVLIISDFLSTGNSVQAAADLINNAGANVFESAFIINNYLVPFKRQFNFPIYTLVDITK